MAKKTICLEFDGVLHDYSRGFYDGPVAGAREAVQKLSEQFSVVVQTSCDNLDQVSDWLEQYGFSVDKVTNKKPPAVVYIDDRGLRFESWEQTLSALDVLLGLREKQVITKDDVGSVKDVLGL
jgi:hypothetical protein